MIGERSLPQGPALGVAMATVLGLFVAAGLTFLPLGLFLPLSAAILLGVLFLLRPEWTLALFAMAVIMLSEYTTAPGSGAFYLPEPDVPGLPKPTQIAILGMAGVYFAYHVVMRERGMRLSLGPAAVVLSVVAVGLFNGVRLGNPTDLMRDELYRLVFPVILFYLCANVIDTRPKAMLMLKAIFAATLAKSVILNIYYLMGRGVPYQYEDPLAPKRFLAVTYDPADLIAVSLMISVFVLATIYRHREMLWSHLIAAALVLAPLVFTVVFSHRRAVWIGLAATFGLFFVLTGWRVGKRLVPYMALMGVLAMAAWTGMQALGDGPGTGMENVKQSFASIFDKRDSSNRHHAMEARVVLDELLKKPLLGKGLGSTHARVWRLEWANQPTHIVHNTWLYLWMKLGLPGVILLAVGSAGFLLKALRHGRRYPERILTTALASNAGHWLMLFLVSPLVYYYRRAFLVALFLSVTLTLMRADREEQAAAQVRGSAHE